MQKESAKKSRYFQTAERMDRAFLELLEKKDFAYITVKELCQSAGVNRSTFYLHYETMEDLLCESIEYLQQDFLAFMKSAGLNAVGSLKNCPKERLYLATPDYLRPYLCYIKEQKRLFQTAVENAQTLRMDKTYDKMFRHIFSPILEQFQILEKDRAYVMAYYIHGIMAVIGEWLKRDCEDSVDRMIEMISGLIMQHEKQEKK